MNDRDYRTIVKMVEYCDNVASFLNEFSDNFEAYCADVRTRYACDMCVIQIGELVGRLSDELKDSYSNGSLDANSRDAQLFCARLRFRRTGVRLGNVASRRSGVARRFVGNSCGKMS